MGKRGPKPREKIEKAWTANLAYAIGLLATDGCVSLDGRHVSFVSKDLEQVHNLVRVLGISNRIGKNIAGSRIGYTHRVQFGDVSFVKFLLDMGIGPAKSKTIGEVKIPGKYFFDFLRGCFDGDGSIFSYWDKRWKRSFMFYLSFVSASRAHIDWLRSEISAHLHITGHITKSRASSVLQLKYAKRDSILIIDKMYYMDDLVCLSRKRLKIKRILDIVAGSSRG